MRSFAASFAISLAAFVVIVLLPVSANAFERQWHVGAGAGYAMLVDNGTYPGFGGTVHLDYGLTDAFNAHAELNMSTHPGGDFAVLGFGAGITYIIDIVEWVPYFGLTIGAYDRWVVGDCGGSGEVNCHSGRFGISVPFGLDYIVTRNVAVGFSGRYTMMLPGIVTPASFLAAYARAEYIWGY